jgi:hypothetical protein
VGTPIGVQIARRAADVPPKGSLPLRRGMPRVTKEVSSVLVQTEDVLYDVDLARSAYRVVDEDPDTGDRLLGVWRRYDRISPVRSGQPLRIFVAVEETGRRLLYRIVVTTPVTAVLAA